MRKTTKKIASLVLAGAMVVTSAPVTSEAATATVKLNKSSATVTVGKTVTLKVSKKNVSSKNKVTKIKSKTWKSKKTSIATVSGGKVKGVKAGSTTITCKVTYTVKKNKKTTSKTKTLSCKVTVNPKKVTPTEAPATKAPASTAAVPTATAPAASDAPASGAPASGTPASGTPASGAPASGTPASQTPSASAAPSASASAAPSASASAAPSASASAAPAIATAAPASATTTPTPEPITVQYTGKQFKYDKATHLKKAAETEISFQDLFVYDTTGENKKKLSETVEIRISKVGDTTKDAGKGDEFDWESADNNGEYAFEHLEAGTAYTFAARVKAKSGVHGAGTEDSFTVSTIGTKINVEGVTWQSEKTQGAGTKLTAGGEAKYSDDNDAVLDVSKVKYTNASSGEEIKLNESDTVTFKYAKNYTLDTNTTVELDVVFARGDKSFYGKAEVLVPVKAKTPVVSLVDASEDNAGVEAGYIKIAKIGVDAEGALTEVPAGLQYVVSPSAPDDKAVWTNVTNLTFNNGGKNFAIGQKLWFKIADSTSVAKTAEGGWTGSDVSSDAVTLDATTIGKGNDLATIMNTAEGEYSDETNTFTVGKNGNITLTRGDFTVSGDVTLTGDLTIGSGATLTNNGTITNNGTLTLTGSLVNNNKVTLGEDADNIDLSKVTGTGFITSSTPRIAGGSVNDSLDSTTFSAMVGKLGIATTGSWTSTWKGEGNEVTVNTLTKWINLIYHGNADTSTNNLNSITLTGLDTTKYYYVVLRGSSESEMVAMWNPTQLKAEAQKLSVSTAPVSLFWQDVEISQSSAKSPVTIDLYVSGTELNDFTGWTQITDPTNAAYKNWYKSSTDEKPNSTMTKIGSFTVSDESGTWEKGE